MHIYRIFTAILASMSITNNDRGMTGFFPARREKLLESRQGQVRSNQFGCAFPEFFQGITKIATGNLVGLDIFFRFDVYDINFDNGVIE